MSDIDYIALTKLCTHCQFQQVMYNSNDAFISIPIFYLYYRDASNNVNSGLNIGVDSGVEAKVIVKGEVTFNSNGRDGLSSGLNTNDQSSISIVTCLSAETKNKSNK